MVTIDDGGFLAGVTQQNLHLTELHQHLLDHLRRCAPLAWRQAAQSCPPAPDGRETAEGCQAYHQIWQYLRLLGINTSIDSDSEFLLSVLRQLLREHSLQDIHLSGAADFSLLAHVLWAGRLADRTPAIDLLDRCPTALWANDWYATQQNRKVILQLGDILAADQYGAARFDLVAAHNLLVFFAPRQRSVILQHWYQWLKPGGYLVTVVTVRPDSCVAADEPQAMPAEQVQRIGAMTARARQDHEVDLSAAELVQAALRFAGNARVYHLSSAVDFLQTLTDHGFQIRVAQCVPQSNPLRDCPAHTRQRLRIVARKPVTAEPGRSSP
jgi:SAM-dependent methyltransferase